MRLHQELCGFGTERVTTPRLEGTDYVARTIGSMLGLRWVVCRKRLIQLRQRTRSNSAQIEEGYTKFELGKEKISCSGGSDVDTD